MKDAPRVVIGLLAYKSEKYIRYCLKSLEKQTYSNIHVVVWNNYTPDEVDDIVTNEFPNVELIKSEENTGFGKGHNRIFNLNPNDLYLCLNVDIIVEPNFVKDLVNCLYTHPKAGMVTGKVMRWDFENDKKTNFIDTMGLTIHPSNKVTDIGTGEEDKGQYDGTREVFGLSGAVFLIRPEVMKELGGFDERMFMYKEDVDLSYRMQWMGRTCFVTSKAVAYHDRTEQVGRVSKKVRGMSFVHHHIMLKKNMSPDYPSSIKFKTWLYESAKGFYTFFTNFMCYQAWHHIKGEIKETSKKVPAQEMLRWFSD